MAIQVSGTTVIGNDRALSSVNGLKTVGGTSILGSGDIATGGASVLFDSNNWANANIASNNGNTASFSGGTNGRWILATPVTGGNGNNISGSGTVGINGTGAWGFAHARANTTGSGKYLISGETFNMGASSGGNVGFTAWVPSDGNITIKTTSQSNNGTWQGMSMSIKYRDI
tara:strand:+ start:59 stop:574 length:516 start_codon:yes stop_codon:yes gene_type:complete